MNKKLLRLAFNSERKQILPIATLLVASVGVAGFFISHRIRSNNEVVLRLKRGPIVEAVYGIGTVTSRKSYELRIGITSEVEDSFVKEGDEVKKDSPLIRLVGIPVFRAPFPGTVVSAPFMKGEAVFPQAPILTLMDIKDRYVAVTLEQEGALRVRKKQKVKLSFESIRATHFEGEVVSVFPQQGQFIVHIDIPSLPEEILPGMSADVAIEVARRENVLLVPLSAVHEGRIIGRRDGEKRKIELKIGSTDGEWAEVISGDIQENDEILGGK